MRSWRPLFQLLLHLNSHIAGNFKNGKELRYALRHDMGRIGRSTCIRWGRKLCWEHGRMAKRYRGATGNMCNGWGCNLQIFRSEIGIVWCAKYTSGIWDCIRLTCGQGQWRLNLQCPWSCPSPWTDGSAGHPSAKWEKVIHLHKCPLHASN